MLFFVCVGDEEKSLRTFRGIRTGGDMFCEAKQSSQAYEHFGFLESVTKWKILKKLSDSEVESVAHKILDPGTLVLGSLIL